MSGTAKPISYVSSAEQQHMLFLFFPVKKGTFGKALETMQDLHQNVLKLSDPGPGDIRAATGVHFFLFYALPANQKPPLKVTSFQTEKDKDLLVVISIYDADFAPYIKSFVQQPVIAAGLNGILSIMDESNIPGIDANGPNSAHTIMKLGGVQAAPDQFNCLLMNYNFADPTAPGMAYNAPGTAPNPIFGATFPGLTVGKILQYYSFNDAKGSELYPFPPVKDMVFQESKKPKC
jgi:hypothetical protein